MKKVFAILFSLLFLISLCSCGEAKNPPAEVKAFSEKPFAQIGKTHTSFEGMEIEIINASWTEAEAKLEVKWKNETLFDALFGENFDIKRERDGVWESCVNTDSLYFSAIGYDLEPGKTRTKTYNLSNFDVSEKGNYRFESDCFIYDKGRGSESTKCEMWAEFTVVKETGKTVRETGEFSNITLLIPDGWKYETERSSNSEDYCISFWPEEQPGGKIEMWYFDAFGVCGTGLETEKIKLGKYECTKGTYDSKRYFDHIIFEGLPGSYVALNEGADRWWETHGEEALQILASATLAKGVLLEEDAIELAKKKVAVAYNETRTWFDTEKGIWEITFLNKKTFEKEVFTVTNEGKVTKEKGGK